MISKICMYQEISFDQSLSIHWLKSGGLMDIFGYHRPDAIVRQDLQSELSRSSASTQNHLFIPTFLCEALFSTHFVDNMLFSVHVVVF